MTRNFNCRRPATEAKYSVNNVFGNLLCTESENLDTWLPNSNFIRTEYTPQTRILKFQTRKLLSYAGGKTWPFLQPDLSPALATKVRTYVLASPAVRREFSRLRA